MTALNELPQEVLYNMVLYNIVSRLSPGFDDLLNCSLVCRAVGEVATTVLYSHIDLRIDQRDDESDAKTQRRQLRLLRSLAEYIPSILLIPSS
jgi:hypothetical protein